MSSLNIDLNYFIHPKTKRLIGRLGRGAEVLPLKLWAYCGKVHMRDGKLAGYTAPEIETIVEWWGKAGECIRALLDVRFLVKTEDGYAVHEWEEWQGHLYAYHVRAKKGATAKWKAMKGGDASSNASSTQEAPDKQCPSMAVHDSTSPQPPKGGGRGLGGGARSARVRDAEQLLADRRIAENNGHATRNGGGP